MSSEKARKIIRSQMRRAISGSHGGQRAHIRRAEMIAELIYQRFQVLPPQWQVKHCRWLLEHALRDRSNGTRYHYYRTLRLVIEKTTSHWDHWQPLLRGSWQRPTAAAGQINRTGRSRQ